MRAAGVRRRGDVLGLDDVLVAGAAPGDCEFGAECAEDGFVEETAEDVGGEAFLAFLGRQDDGLFAEGLVGDVHGVDGVGELGVGENHAFVFEVALLEDAAAAIVLEGEAGVAAVLAPGVGCAGAGGEGRGAGGAGILAVIELAKLGNVFVGDLGVADFAGGEAHHLVKLLGGDDCVGGDVDPCCQVMAGKGRYGAEDDEEDALVCALEHVEDVLLLGVVFHQVDGVLDVGDVASHVLIRVEVEQRFEGGGAACVG